MSLDINSQLGWQSKTPQRTMIRLQGTTTAAPNKTKTWTTVITKIGNDFTYEKDTVLGDRFRVVVPGIYAISYGDTAGAADYIGLTINADPATGVTSVDQSQILVLAYEASANVPAIVSWTGVLKAGDVVRCHWGSGVGSGGNAQAQVFTMTKVGD